MKTMISKVRVGNHWVEVIPKTNAKAVEYSDGKSVYDVLEPLKAKVDNEKYAVAFSDYESLVTSLKSYEPKSDGYRIGQDFYIKTLNVPDLWISGFSEEYVDYNYTTDTAFVELLSSALGIQIGFVILSPLEAKNTVVWDNYVQFTDYATSTKPGVVLLDDDALIFEVHIDSSYLSIYLGDICGDSTTIDWGDGNINQAKGHEYKTAGDYTIKVYSPKLNVSSALYQQDQIIHAKLPKTMSVIPYAWFRECRNLKSVELPEGLLTISNTVFYLCSSLKTIEIPSTVTSIGQNAFYRNDALTTVVFKSSTPIEYDSLWFNKSYYIKKVLVPNEALDAYKSAWTSETRLDALACITDMPPTMNFVYKELAANTRYPIKRNGYYMVYCNSANLTLAKKDGTAVVEGAKQIQFMTPPIEGSTSIKACGIYWTGSSFGVEGFRRSTNDGGYVTATTEFFVAEMVKEG